MKVSVVMTCYNSSKYIKEQLDTIFPELTENDELIICDDCSSDNTVGIIGTYNDSRIKFFRNDYNMGANKNFEQCLTKVTGDIVVVADSDNIWLPGKIKYVLHYFDDSKVNLVMHDAIITDEKLNPIIDSYFEWRNSKPGLLRNIIRNGYGGSMMAFKSSVLKHILPFPKKMPFFFDEWVGMMCEKYGKCIFVKDKLSCWRRHTGTTSSIGAVENEQSRTSMKKNSKVKLLLNRIKERVRKIWLAIVR